MARLTDKVLPGVVVCTLGHWRSGPGGATVNALTPAAFADLGRAPTFSDNAVEVAPVAS